MKKKCRRINLDWLIESFVDEGYGLCGYTKYDIGGDGHFANIPLSDKEKYIEQVGEDAKKLMSEKARMIWDDESTENGYENI